MRPPEALTVPGGWLTREIVDEYSRNDSWRPVTLGSYLSDAVGAHTDKVAAISVETVSGRRSSVTYGELADLVARVAAGLRALGVDAGDVVTVMLPNRVECASAIWAILRLGAIYTGIPVSYGRREAAAILRRTRSRILFVPSPSEFGTTDYLLLARQLREEAPTLDHVVVLGQAPHEDGWLTFAELLNNDGRRFDSSLLPGALAHIGFTSGTTGEPKGAMNTHQTLDFVARRWLEHVGDALLNDKTINLIPSPIGHHTGFLWGVLMTAYLGGTAIFLDRWNPRTAASVIAEEGVTTMIVAPTFLQDLIQVDGADYNNLSSLRLIAIAGAPIPRGLVSQAREQLGCFICPAWGMTEYGIGISGSPSLPRDRVEATDGRPVPGCEVRVVRADGKPAPAELEGDLEIRGAGLFVGYYERPDATDEAIVSGWFRTGDRAVLHADGFVSLSGRSKDIIIRGGENVPVFEVESLLYRHPAVLEAVVVGFPDERLGERGCAILVVKPGTEIDLASLCSFLAGEGLSKPFLPERLEVVEALPKTPSGKVRKVELRAWLAEGP